MEKLRKTLIAIFAAVFVFTVCNANLPRTSAAYYVYFTAVNDNLLQLSPTDMPVNLNGVTYVPYTTFHSTELG
ncbi:MAG: hypothetical protein LBC38_03670, partial [Oscillospiraceae bacterium]|nr:hypothetical protein [Oscillospiraceae bacterium]